MSLRKIEDIFTSLFLVSIISFPRSYLVLKLFFILLFILSHIFTIIKRKRLVLDYGVPFFYIQVIIAGTIWSIVGIINEGATKGIIDNFRLYVVWSFAYTLIILLLKQGNKMKIFHSSVVISGIVISLINFAGLYDFYYQSGLISASTIEELDLRFGFHEGYVQMTSHNIGSLFFIVPYLIAIGFRNDSSEINSRMTKISLLLTIVLTILSGRRALWVCVALTPVIILGLSYITKSIRRLGIRAKIFSFALIISGIIGMVVFTQSKSLDIPTLNHLKAAFSAEDERSIQKDYLIDGFLKYPLMGSGFGMDVGYLRNEKMPWLYELTYHQILFNFGIFGTLFLLFFFLIFLFVIIKWIQANSEISIVPFCILIGFFSFLIGAYSNPYFGSFDFLIYIGMLPYLAVFGSRIIGRNDNNQPVAH